MFKHAAGIKVIIAGCGQAATARDAMQLNDFRYRGTVKSRALSGCGFVVQMPRGVPVAPWRLQAGFYSTVPLALRLLQ